MADSDSRSPRRAFLGASATAFAIAASALGSATAAAQTYRDTDTAEKSHAASNPGPEDQPVAGQEPDVLNPPPSDHGLPQNFWASFSTSHRRIEAGGWTRQVNVQDFPISKDITGVNMRLTAGGIRELHWHVQDEWSIMLYGNARITVLDAEGRPFVDDVGPGDLWYFPAGFPHSIQGTGPDGCEFLLIFDDGNFSEEDTTLISDWVKHVPREVLAKNWGVPESTVAAAVSKLPEGGKYIFQAPVPPSLAADRAGALKGGGSASPHQFTFRPSQMRPQKQDRGGFVRIVDSTNFTVAKNIAMAHVTVHPGALRELHWHPNANEWQYYIGGNGRMTVFFNHSEARTADFHPGDVGYVPQTFGHYIENLGNDDLVFLEIFKTDRYQDFSLNEWIRHLPPELVRQHLDIDQATLDSIPTQDYAVLPH